MRGGTDHPGLKLLINTKIKNHQQGLTPVANQTPGERGIEDKNASVAKVKNRGSRLSNATTKNNIKQKTPESKLKQTQGRGPRQEAKEMNPAQKKRRKKKIRTPRRPGRGITKEETSPHRHQKNKERERGGKKFRSERYMPEKKREN